jgi:ribosomal protein S11
MAVRKRVKKKKDIKLQSAILHVHTTRQNTIVTLSDEQGNKLFG